MLYYQSMHKNFEDKERKKHISNLIRFFYSFFLNFHFSVESHYLDHPLFEQTFFRKKLLLFFYHFQHGIFFLTTPFYSRQNTFSFDIQQSFFEENEYDIHFFNFFFFFFKTKHHSISGKKQSEKPFFFILSFRNFEHGF